MGLIGIPLASYWIQVGVGVGVGSGVEVGVISTVTSAGGVGSLVASAVGASVGVAVAVLVSVGGTGVGATISVGDGGVMLRLPPRLPLAWGLAFQALASFPAPAPDPLA